MFEKGDLVRDKHLYGTDGKKAFGIIVKFHRRHRDYDWGCCYEVYFVNHGTTNRRPSYLEKVNAQERRQRPKTRRLAKNKE